MANADSLFRTLHRECTNTDTYNPTSHFTDHHPFLPTKKVAPMILTYWRTNSLIIHDINMYNLRGRDT